MNGPGTAYLDSCYNICIKVERENIYENYLYFRSGILKKENVDVTVIWKERTSDGIRLVRSMAWREVIAE